MLVPGCDVHVCIPCDGVDAKGSVQDNTSPWAGESQVEGEDRLPHECRNPFPSASPRSDPGLGRLRVCGVMLAVGTRGTRGEPPIAESKHRRNVRRSDIGR